MSRAGRGGRGGRGGARSRRGRPNVPWDTGEEPDARPSELFPPYAVPQARPLSGDEKGAVQDFLLLRHQLQASPLYTAKRTSLHDPTAPRKVYSQAQANAPYDVRKKASADPFTAMPTHAHKFVAPERALPDWSARPLCRELFPAELLDTVEPHGSGGAHGTKRRRLELSKVQALPNAEAAFGMPSLDDEGGKAEGDASAERAAGGRELLDRLDALREEEGGEEGGEVEDEAGLGNEEEEDEVYDDEDAGDYDAEEYFDNGDDMGEDYGEGDDGEATY